MSSFMISYDLHTPGQKYDALTNTIKNACTRKWKLLDSTWLVTYSGTSGQLVDTLKKCLDANDNLIVVSLDGKGAWWGYDLTKYTPWIKQTLAG